MEHLPADIHERDLVKTVIGTIPSGPCYRVDLLSVVLPNGQTLRAVIGGDGDIVWSGNPYYAVASGVWSRGAVTSAAMFGLSSHSLDLSVVAGDTVTFPGTGVPMAASFASGAWDGATVSITTAYMALGSYGQIAATMTLWAGMVSAVQRTGRSSATVSCQDWLYLCNLEVPRRVVQPSCFATFGDAACTFALAGIGVANTVAAGSTPVQIVPATAWPASDSLGNAVPGSYSGALYFDNGKLTWTSGKSAGFSSHIQAMQPNGTLVLTAAPPFAVAIGDGFTAYAGCQKSVTDCTQRWRNQAHFLGMPWIPVPEQAM